MDKFIYLVFVSYTYVSYMHKILIHSLKRNNFIQASIGIANLIGMAVEKREGIPFDEAIKKIWLKVFISREEDFNLFFWSFFGSCHFLPLCFVSSLYSMVSFGLFLVSFWSLLVPIGNFLFPFGPFFWTLNLMFKICTYW